MQSVICEAASSRSGSPLLQDRFCRLYKLHLLDPACALCTDRMGQTRICSALLLAALFALSADGEGERAACHIPATQFICTCSMPQVPGSFSKPPQAPPPLPPPPHRAEMQRPSRKQSLKARAAATRPQWLVPCLLSCRRRLGPDQSRPPEENNSSEGQQPLGASRLQQRCSEFRSPYPCIC